MIRRPPRSTLFPLHDALPICSSCCTVRRNAARSGTSLPVRRSRGRSEEHTSELQSHSDLVCRLLLEKKKQRNTTYREPIKAENTAAMTRTDRTQAQRLTTLHD